mgnify:FL=1
MIKVGIIGAGRIGRVHGESVTSRIKGVQLAAMADPFWTEDARKWASEMEITAYTDYHF